MTPTSLNSTAPRCLSVNPDPDYLEKPECMLPMMHSGPHVNAPESFSTLGGEIEWISVVWSQGDNRFLGMITDRESDIEFGDMCSLTLNGDEDCCLPSCHYGLHKGPGGALYAS